MTAPSVPRDAVLAELCALEEAGLGPVLFGGWAKEIWEQWPEGRPHRDLDVLLTGADPESAEAFATRGGRSLDAQRRHAHKRAYCTKAGLAVELMLLRRDAGGLYCDCYGHYRYRWHAPLGAVRHACPVPVATPENIRSYERAHGRVQAAFFEAYPDLRRHVEALHGRAHFPYDADLIWPASPESAAEG